MKYGEAWLALLAGASIGVLMGLSTSAVANIVITPVVATSIGVVSTLAGVKNTKDAKETKGEKDATDTKEPKSAKEVTMLPVAMVSFGLMIGAIAGIGIRSNHILEAHGKSEAPAVAAKPAEPGKSGKPDKPDANNPYGGYLRSQVVLAAKDMDSLKSASSPDNVLDALNGVRNDILRDVAVILTNKRGKWSKDEGTAMMTLRDNIVKTAEVEAQ